MKFPFKKKLFIAIALILGLLAVYFGVSYFIKKRPAPATASGDENISQNEKPNPADGACEIKDVLETDNKFPDEIKSLDSPAKIADYLKNNFTISGTEKDAALEPKDFLAAKTGNTGDVAVFAAYVLDYHNFEAGVIRYSASGQNNPGKESFHSVAIFRDKDTPEYLSINSGKIEIIAHGWSFADLIKKEESLLNIKIGKYAFLNQVRQIWRLPNGLTSNKIPQGKASGYFSR